MVSIGRKNQNAARGAAERARGDGHVLYGMMMMWRDVEVIADSQAAHEPVVNHQPSASLRTVGNAVDNVCTRGGQTVRFCGLQRNMVDNPVNLEIALDQRLCRRESDTVRGSAPHTRGRRAPDGRYRATGYQRFGEGNAGGQAVTESATITEPLKRHRPPTERPTGDVKSS